MADYGNYCPIALGAEVIADRWTPLIIRELILGNTRFNEIARGLPGISRSLLVQRLRHLERKGVIETRPAASGRGHEYHLTAAGRQLEPVIMALGSWAVQWLFHDMDPEDVDAITLMWWMHRTLDAAHLPADRVVIQLEHTAPQRVTAWLVLDRGDASLCVQHPGFDVDVIVTCETPRLGEVFMGLERWDRAVAVGAIRVDGPPRLVRALPRWFSWSPFAPEVGARAAAVTP